MTLDRIHTDARVLMGDVREQLRKLKRQSVHAVVTSPPYWALRDYGVAGQMGLEQSPQEFVCNLVKVFRAVRRVLRDDGTLWLNIGDSYAASGGGGGGSAMQRRGAGSWTGRAGMRGFRRPPNGYKKKDMVQVAAMLASALQADGWYLRCTIIWDKMVATEPLRADRPGTAHEYVFLLSKNEHYWTSKDMPHSTVWRERPIPAGGDHPALMHPRIAERCVLAGCPQGGTVLDPFAGAGTTGGAALAHDRKAILIELRELFVDMIPERIEEVMRYLLEAPEPVKVETQLTLI